MTELAKGTLVGDRYRVAQPIGEGGIGAVYRAHDTEVGKDVALKWLKAELSSHETLRPRFEREAKLLAELSHPGIVLVTDYGEHEGGAFLVMELLQGLTLGQRMRQGPLPEADLRRILQELLSTLAAVHGAGVMHRDIKPGNIFLVGENADGPVKLLDFGFARRIEATADALQRAEPQLTRANTAFGTPRYMAPEQATVGEMDARTDLYAVGVILFEMIAGKAPYAGEVPQILRQHIASPIPALQPQLPGLQVAPELQAFVERAMAKRPADRFQSADAMAEALRALPDPSLWAPDLVIDTGDDPTSALRRPTSERPDTTMEVQLDGPDRAVITTPGVSAPPPLPPGAGSRAHRPPPLPRKRPANPTRKSAAPPPPASTSQPPSGKQRPTRKRTSGAPPVPASAAAVPPVPASASAVPPVPASASAVPPVPASASAVPPVPASASAGGTGQSAPAAPLRAASFIEGTLDDERLATTLEQQLRDRPDAARTARLHFELATLHEQRTGDLGQACKHYLEAAKRQPKHLPSVAGARRLLLQTGKRRESLAMLDREITLQATPERRAQLLWQKGQLIERTRGKASDALSAYQKGLELDASHLDLLHAVARIERAQGQWDALDSTLARLAACSQGDLAYAAALVAERARIADNRQGDTARASELYLSALVLDADLPGAIEALKRDSRTRGQWQRLVQTLEQEVTRSTGSQVIAAAYATIAAIHVEQLGQRPQGISALQAAVEHTPDDRTLLLRLAALHAEAAQHDDEVGCLRRAVELTPHAPERAALHHRIAQRCEQALAAPEQAVVHYRKALEADPSHTPSLHALAALYRAQEDFAGIRDLLGHELTITADPGRRAALHYRLGQLLAQRLDDRAGAVEQMRLCRAIAPQHDAALRALDRLLSTAGRIDELVQVYEQAVEQAPEPTAAVSHLMRMAALREGALNDPAGAADCYQRVIALQPEHREAMYGLQRAAAIAEAHDKWLQAIDMELAEPPSAQRGTALLLQAAELLDGPLEDPEAAIARLRRVRDADPDNLQALDLLADLYARLQQWDALLEVEQARLPPAQDRERRADALVRMGALVEDHVGDGARAAGYYEDALQAEPLHAQAHAALVRLQRTAADWKGLARSLQRSLDAHTDARDRAHLACELGDLLERQMGDPNAALRAHEQALQALPAFRPSTDARIRLLCAAKRYPELAKACLHEAEHAPDPASALDALMRAAAVHADLLDEPKEAAAIYERVLERSPGHPAALHALQALYTATGDDGALARTDRALATRLQDAGNRVAVLRELTRLVEDPAPIHAEIAHLWPHDVEALSALAAAAGGKDAERHARCEQALADLSQDRGEGAAHLLRVGAALETTGPAQALAAYERALKLDPASALAARGMSRVARALGDAAAMRRAAHAEAEVTTDRAVAVGLYLEAASLRRAAGDAEGAAADAEHALQLDPSHVQAAQQLSTVLRSLGQTARLCDLLGRAARQGARGADLYTEVARLRADELGDVPEAIAALQRALTCQPHHLEALERLPQLLKATGQWERAADAYAQLLEHTGDQALRTEAHLAIASLCLQQLGQPDRAQQHLTRVLAKQAEHREALRLKALMLQQRGHDAQALPVLEQLRGLAQTRPEQAAVQIELAEALRRCQQPKEATEALAEAVTLEGPDGEAARRYRALIGHEATWDGYVAALETHMKGADGADACSRALRAIAEAQSEGMRAPKRALATLEAGARDYPDDAPLWLAFARQLTRVGQADDAVEVYRRLIPRCADEPGLWKGLSDAQRALGRQDEAVHSGLPLLLLDAADSRQLVELRGRKPSPRIAPGVLDDVALSRLDGDGVLDSAATRLARTMADVLSRLHPTDLKRMGLTRRQRIDPDAKHPLRRVADGLSGPLGLGSVELYLHDAGADGTEGDAQGSPPRVRVGLGDPPLLLVPQTLADAPESVQRFGLCRAMFCVAQGLGAVEALTAERLATLMAGAIRRQVPSFTAPGLDETAVEDAARAVGKALPWLGRSSVDDVAASMGKTPVDLLGWVAAVRQVAARTALLLSDDLLPGLEQLRRGDDWSPFTDPAALDLLQFWTGDAAVAHRQG